MALGDFDSNQSSFEFGQSLLADKDRRDKKARKRQKKMKNVSYLLGTVAVADMFMANKARKKAVVLLKQRRVMEEIEKNVKDVAKALGVNHEYILRSLKHLADYSDDQNIALQSLKELGKAIGTLGGQVKKVETGVVGMFQGFSPEQLQSARRQIEEKKEV